MAGTASAGLVGRYEHLKNRPKSSESLPLLEKIASQVKPIMVKRNWTVGVLAEFLPSDPSLLGNNMNRGQRINLRLRPPGQESTFYEYDQLVLVMLHELTHNEHGPHGPAFYKLLSELEEEYYELKRKGYSGEGFHSSGNHLSGLKLDEYHGRAKGLQAAEKRLAVQKKIGKGGVLGGKSVLGRSMKEVVAEAAERRIRDDKICHSETDGGVQAEVEKAQRESEGVDADQLGSSSTASVEGSGDTIPNPPKTSPSTASPRSQVRPRPTAALATTRHIPSSLAQRPNPVASSSKSRPPIIDLTDDLDDLDSSSPPVPLPSAKSTEWPCPTCTLLNPTSSTSCEVCTTPRPGLSSNTQPNNKVKTEEGWYCEFCTSGPRDMSYWSCGECGWVRKWG